MKLRYSARTDVGRTRDHNEDDYAIGEGPETERLGTLMVVCDGMGGHAAGEVASSLGVRTIMSVYYESAGGAGHDEMLRSAFETANARIHAEGRGTMGTTGVAALLDNGRLLIANVGDSRAYLIRDGAIQQISRDHSLVEEQVAAGVITAEQARTLHYRNVITRALGYQQEVLVDIFELPLAAGDTVVLSSDGLHGLVSDEEIARIALAEPLAEAPDRLIELANERGGNDNITVVIARIDGLDAQNPTAKRTDEESARATIELQAAALTEQLPRYEADPPASAARAPERRLTMIGGLLATLTLVALAAVILFTINQPAVDPRLIPASISPAPTVTAIPPTPTPAVTPTSGATPTPSE
jgi:protein phosphatase